MTLCSEPITHPYVTRKVRIKFADGCDNEMRVEVLLSSDDSTPASGRPSGSSIFADYGQVEYVVGNDEVVEVSHEVEVPEGNSFVKVYADNRDFYVHALLAQVTIESIERR